MNVYSYCDVSVESEAEFKGRYDGRQNWNSAEAHRQGIMHTFLTVGVERHERVAAQSSLESRHQFDQDLLQPYCN
jgi:hypothetical protein